MVVPKADLATRACSTRGTRSSPTAPAAAPPCLSHEVAQGYKDVKEISAIVRFKVQGYGEYLSPGLDHHPLDPALQPGPVREPQGNLLPPCAARAKTFIMAKALVEKVSAGEDADASWRKCPAERPAGHGLRAPVPLCGVGQGRLVRGVRQLRHHGRTARASYISPRPLARTTTGCARINGLPFVQLVDTQGCLTQETTWAGVFVKDADPLMLEDLKERGLLFAAMPFAHQLPLLLAVRHAPAVLRPAPPGSSRMTAVRDKLAAQQPLHQLDARQHQGRPHGQLPGKRHRLGIQPGALLGHAPARVDLLTAAMCT